jgi:hypothetical protein
VHAIFAASSDLGNFAGYKQGDPDPHREINIVHDAAIKAGKKLCAPRWHGKAGRTSPASKPAARLRPCARAALHKIYRAIFGFIHLNQGPSEINPNSNGFVSYSNSMFFLRGP